MIIFNSIRHFFVCILIGFFVGVAAAKQPSRANIELLFSEILVRMTTDDVMLDVGVDAVYGSGLSPEKRKVARVMLRSIFSNERMPAYLAKVMGPVRSPTLTENERRAYLREGLSMLQKLGLRRLSTEQKAQRFQYLINMAGAISAKSCKALFLGRVDLLTEALITGRYYASLPVGDFEAVFLLHKAAIEAELAEYPDVKTITPTQAKGAERAYLLAMNARIQRLPAGLNDRVMNNLEAADPVDVCHWFRETTAAVLDLDEPYRGWHLTRLVEGM